MWGSGVRVPSAPPGHQAVYLRCWQADTGKPLWEGGRINRSLLFFRPSGHTLVTHSHIWDADTGKSTKLREHDEDADYPAMVLANYMLGGGFINSRLATRIRQKDGLSYGISSNLTAAAKEKNGAFLVNAIAAPQNVAKVEAAMKEELEKALKDGFTAEEAAAAKSGWLQSRNVGRATDGPLASSLAGLDFDELTMAWVGDFEKKV